MEVSTTIQELERAIAVIAGEVDAIAEDVAARLSIEIPEYRSIPHETLRDAVKGNITRALTAISQERGPTAEELEASEMIGEERARQGVPVATALQAHRLGVRIVWATALEHARRLEVEPWTMIEAAERIWDWADAAMFSVANGHRRIDIERAERDQQRRSTFLRRLLRGALTSAQVHAEAASHGLDLTRSYVTFRARCTSDDDLHAMMRDLQSAHRKPDAPALIEIIDGDLVGVLAEPPRASHNATIGLGPPAPPDGIEASFQLATRAMETASAFGRSGLVSLDDLGLRSAILADEHLGRSLCERYIKPLEERGDFGQQLVATLRELFTRGMRIEETATALFIHPNTLRHRLHRFEELTGADLGRTEDVLAVWWALERTSIE